MAIGFNFDGFGAACRSIGAGAALLAVSAAAVQAAQTPLTGNEFEAYAEGRTLYFYSGGRPYGAERYLPNRRVEWSFLDGECQSGHWYEAGSSICFVYDYNPDSPQCWTFFIEGAGLRAQFEGSGSTSELYEAGEAQDEMICLGPQIGV